MTIQAAHVGVHVAPDRDVYTCARCGIRRTRHKSANRPKHDGMCRDCKSVIALENRTTPTQPASNGTTKGTAA